jgi:hypothetical protein
MASPLDQTLYDNGAAYMPVNTFYGNDDSILVTFPFDTSTYEFIGLMVDSSANELFNLTVTKITTGAGTEGDPYIYKANFAISSDQNKSTPEGAFILLKWIQGGVTNKTFAAGPFTNPKL